MDFREYQKRAHSTAIYPTDIKLHIGEHTLGFPEKEVELSWIYPALGLAGESGEILNKLKKVIRDNDGSLIGYSELISNELGDILWYVSELATTLGLDLNNIAVWNTEKLAQRAKENKIKGSGDNR